MASAMSSRPVKTIDDATASNSNVDTMMAVVMFAVGGGMLYALGQPIVLDVNDRDFNPLIVFVGLMALGGVFYLVRGLRRRAVVGRFGTTVFEQDGFETYIGETLRGRVKTSLPLSAPDGFHLRVRCIERKGETFDEKRRRTRDEIIWEATQTVRTGDSRGGIPVEFLIPPSSLAKAKLGVGDWTLKVEATVDGKPFEATFPLRVSGGSRAEDEAEDAAAEAAADAADEAAGESAKTP